MRSAHEPDAGVAFAALHSVAEQIVEVGEYLVAPLSNATIDALAAFEAEGEDRENDLEDEQVNEDGSNESALDWTMSSSGNHMIDDGREFDCPEARRRFIAERQKPGHLHEYHGKRFVDPRRYDPTRDQQEVQKTRAFLAGVRAKKGAKRAKAG